MTARSEPQNRPHTACRLGGSSVKCTATGTQVVTGITQQCETTEAQALSSGSTSELDLMTAMSGHVLHRIKLQQTCQLVDSPALLTVSMAVMVPVLLR